MCSLIPTQVVMSYDGTAEGFFSLVFHAYATCCMPAAIAQAGCVQVALGQEVVGVATDLAHAERVRVGLARSAGARMLQKAKMVLLSEQEGSELALLRYIELAMEVGYRVHSDVANPVVDAVERIVRAVLNEREKMYQFARFEELEGGVYFAQVNPRAKLVPLVMEHFSARFNTQPFVIYDEAHHMAGVYDMKREYLVETDGIVMPKRAGHEEEFQLLWKTFYDSVSNEQRYNPDLRRSFMPKRYWRNLTEMQRAVA